MYLYVWLVCLYLCILNDDVCACVNDLSYHILTILYIVIWRSTCASSPHASPPSCHSASSPSCHSASPPSFRSASPTSFYLRRRAASPPYHSRYLPLFIHVISLSSFVLSPSLHLLLSPSLHLWLSLCHHLSSPPSHQSLFISLLLLFLRHVSLCCCACTYTHPARDLVLLIIPSASSPFSLIIHCFLPHHSLYLSLLLLVLLHVSLCCCACTYTHPA